MTPSAHRPEIDGLRAIAVSLVLVFHFFPVWLPHGYLGVDLFFVISGYVITSKLVVQISSDRFTFRGFFAGRIRRILPLTFVALTVTVVAGYALLLPADFARLISSAMAVATFWANVFFWLDGGYFGGADKLKPLLHMWSLSVEEQFYLVFPILLWMLMALLGLRGRKLLIAMAAITTASLGTYVLLRVIGGVNPAFFMMPTRAWQFGLGAMAAIAVAYGLRSTMGAVALVGVGGVLAMVFVDVTGAWNEIIVAMGVAIYLTFASGRGWFDRALSSPLMTYLGLRSFSLYLWHWPLVAFMNYAFFEGTPLVATLGGLALCIAMSELSYRLIERPFRFRFPIGYTLGLIAASVAIIAAINVRSWSRNDTSFMNAIAAQIQSNFRCGLDEFAPYGGSRACVLARLRKADNVAIVGNSHAQMYARAIAESGGAKDRGVILVPLNNCMPTVTLNLSVHCLQLARSNLDSVLADHSVSTVIIGTTYSAETFVSDRGESFTGSAAAGHVAASLLDLVTRLHAAKAEVIVIGPLLTPGYDLPSRLGRSLKFGAISEDEARAALIAPRADFDARYAAIVASLAEHLGERLLQPHRILCDTHTCRFGDAGGSFFADSNHLGTHGVATVAEMFDQL